MPAEQTVSKTILEQLGGSRFVAMTGAHTILPYDDGVTFKIMRGEKRINAVQIKLTGTDEYDVEFLCLTPPRLSQRTGQFSGGRKLVAKASSVQVARLRETFTQHTGLDTSL